MSNRLQGFKIAVLATDGFEETELASPVATFRAEGAEVRIVAPKPGTIRAWRHKEWAGDIKVDLEIKAFQSDDFDALYLPGGVMSPDQLRMIPEAVEIVKAFSGDGKPIAAICHGPWLLAEADVIAGKTVTSWPSLKTDLRNAGATWVDREVVADGYLITSRKPDDIPAFSEACIAQFSRSLQAAQA